MEKLIDIHKFGRYQVIEILGKGSMSTVYRAEDPLLGREVAIKAIYPHLTLQPEFAKRFEREVRTIAALNHPNILEIFDMGKEEDIYYMVLRLVCGGTLKERLQSYLEKKLLMPLQEVENILLAICNALEYIHSHGIIHRDLKPANVMFDKQGRPMLTDFGLVKITGGESYTITRGVVGTPLYMSPEQCKQDSVDQRCDIYSMGTMLYEMTTGKHLFSSSNLGEILLAHLQRQPPSPCEINPELPIPVAQVILKTLEKNPDDRYQTARELAQEFSLALARSNEKSSGLQKDRRAHFRSVTSGNSFRLLESIDNRIGRSKPGKPVEVDLTAEQGGEYVHSLHAIIRFSPSGWELESAQNIRNPVYVNNHELSPGSRIFLSNGDLVRLAETELVIEIEQDQN